MRIHTRMYILFCLLYCFSLIVCNIICSIIHIRMFLLLSPGRLLFQFVYGPTGSYHIFRVLHVSFSISSVIFLAKFAEKNCTSVLSGSYHLYFIFIACQFTSHFVASNASTPHFISFFRILLFICVSISPLAEYPDIV